MESLTFTEEQLDVPQNVFEGPAYLEEFLQAHQRLNTTHVLDSGSQALPQNTSKTPKQQMSFSLSTLSDKITISKNSPPPLVHEDPTLEQSSRYLDLCTFFEQPLWELTLKSKKPCRRCSIKLQMRAYPCMRSQPFLTVFADKAVARKVEKFFLKKANMAQLRPDPGHRLPEFHVLVVPRAPELISNEDVLSQPIEIDVTTLGKSLMGARLRCISEHGTSIATLGGLVKVTSHGEPMLYGLTVAHIATNHAAHNHECMSSANSDQDSDDKDDSEDEVVQISSTGSQEEQSSCVFRLDHAEYPVDQTENSRSQPEWQHFGRLIMTGHNDRTLSELRKTQDLDWALIHIDTPLLCSPNFAYIAEDTALFTKASLINDNQIFSFANMRAMLRRQSTIQVSTATNVPNPSRGPISLIPTSLWLSPSQKAAKVLVLKLSKDHGLRKGDSGTWIVTTGGGTVVGITCARDIDDDLYVIPLESIFLQIREFLGGVDVFLPTPIDVEEFKERCLGRPHLETNLSPMASPITDGEHHRYSDTLAQWTEWRPHSTGRRYRAWKENGIARLYQWDDEQGSYTDIQHKVLSRADVEAKMTPNLSRNEQQNQFDPLWDLVRESTSKRVEQGTRPGSLLDSAIDVASTIPESLLDSAIDVASVKKEERDKGVLFPRTAGDMNPRGRELPRVSTGIPRTDSQASRFTIDHVKSYGPGTTALSTSQSRPGDLQRVMDTLRPAVSRKAVLNAAYKIHHSRDFKRGFVFQVLWHESSGRSQRHEYLSDRPLSENSSGQAYGEPVYSSVRRMVVIQQRATFSICIPINTYGGRGCNKPGLTPNEISHHTVVYEAGRSVQAEEGEVRRGLTKNPIGITLNQGESLNKWSRLRFDKPHSVEHDFKIKPIGQVLHGDMHLLAQYFRIGTAID